MKLEKIIIDRSVYGGKYDAADVVIDVELWDGMHYAYNFVAKAHCESTTHPGKNHSDACYQSDVEKKFGNITAKIMLYEHKKMQELKQ